LKGYRKLFVGLIISVLGMILILIDKFNSDVSNFLIWIYTIFSSANVIEHISSEISKRNKKQDE